MDGPRSSDGTCQYHPRMPWESPQAVLKRQIASYTCSSEVLTYLRVARLEPLRQNPKLSLPPPLYADTHVRLTSCCLV